MKTTHLKGKRSFFWKRKIFTFTLIELLVCISIIAILAAMLLPVLGNAKLASMRVVCMGQVRQLVMAQFDFAADNDTYLAPMAPWDSSTVYSTSYGGAWAQYVIDPSKADGRWTGLGMLYKLDYLGDYRLMWCPGNSCPVAWSTGIAVNHPSHGFRERPWAEGNGRWMAADYHPRSYDPPTKLGKMTQVPSDFGFYADPISNSGYYNTSAKPESVLWRHRTGYNVTYLDGSSEYYKDSTFEIMNYNSPWGKGGGSTATWRVMQKNIWETYLDRN